MLPSSQQLAPLCLLFVSFICYPLMAQTPPAIRPINQNESLVPPYSLPNVLSDPNGNTIASPEQWPSHQRYLLNLLADLEYGHAPPDLPKLDFTEIERGTTPSGKSLRRQYRLTLSRQQHQQSIDVVLYLPPNTTQHLPCFLALNFRGNHAMSNDPAILLPQSWLPDGDGVVDHHATEAGRNSTEHRWPIDAITARGYALASAYYGDFDPDFDDGFENGVHTLYPDWRSNKQHPNRWGSISTWAWGLSRMLDGLQSVPELESAYWMVAGHSRLGKTALWAGANDPRFQIVYSNNSGCGGAALSQRIFGESVARINTSFPHWFCQNFRQFNDHEDQLPFDQHFLIASIAPRPTYIASASLDLWADPLGEFLGGYHANPAYQLLGLHGLPHPPTLPPALPPTGSQIKRQIGFHLREGKHDLTPIDWNFFMDFADHHRKP